MRKLVFVVVAAVVLGLPASAAMTLDQVVSKHVEAHGGDAAWRAIDSIELTGRFTAFSKIADFKLIHSDGRYYWDTVMDGKQVTIGYDGEDLWWDNHWRGAGAKKIEGIDAQVTQRELDYPTPLFGYADKGYSLKLLGEKELEGISGIAVEVTRPDESVETWYLDPETYLELGCESTGSDFGQPRPQLTFFDDFRKVEGVTLAFLTEKQWYTRNRIMEVAEVRFNVDLEEGLFEMPAPPGMGPILDMIGKWSAKDQQRQAPTAPWQESERESTIEAKMNNGLLVETTTSSQGEDVLRMFSYDRFSERYRITSIDSNRAQLSVSEGSFDDAGKLTVSTFDTKTPFKVMGFTVYVRASFFDIEDDSFSVEYEVTVDEGENWWVAGKSTYTRAE